MKMFNLQKGKVLLGKMLLGEKVTLPNCFISVAFMQAIFYHRKCRICKRGKCYWGKFLMGKTTSTNLIHFCGVNASNFLSRKMSHLQKGKVLLGKMLLGEN
jgi:hypothetical protein